MNLKYKNKIKIIFPNKLIIFSFAFLFILFFEINVAQAACTYSSKAYGFNCGKIGKTLGTTSSELSSCASQTDKPADCVSNINNCECCCDKAAATLNTTMPKFKIPDIKLQISIPGLSLTKGADILANCQKDAKGNPTKCTFPWISEYVAGIYKYAIGIVGILAAVVLMIGGVIWIVAGGSATMIGEAKAWIGASLTGLVIALCSYVILYQVNPALVGFKGLEIAMVEQIPVPADAKAFAEKCKPTNSGSCAVSNMSVFGSKASEASAICMAESSGITNAKNTLTKCSNGDYYAVWGLFQFNLSANYLIDADGTKLNCPDAFGNKAWVNSSPNCTVSPEKIELYNKCVAAASNPTIIISNAKRLAGSGWGPWEANSKWCKF